MSWTESITGKSTWVVGWICSFSGEASWVISWIDAKLRDGKLTRLKKLSRTQLSILGIFFVHQIHANHYQERVKLQLLMVPRQRRPLWKEMASWMQISKYLPASLKIFPGIHLWWYHATHKMKNCPNLLSQGMLQEQ